MRVKSSKNRLIQKLFILFVVLYHIIHMYCMYTVNSAFLPPLLIIFVCAQVDCRAATSRICQSVLGKADYQLGRTKVFLKDAHDLYLEQERDRVLTRKILVLQRCIRGWYHRYALIEENRRKFKFQWVFVYVVEKKSYIIEMSTMYDFHCVPSTYFQ